MTNTALTRIAPEVRTLARPSSKPLLAARGLVQRNADLQVAFVRAKADGWGSDRLVAEIEPILEANLEGTPEEVREVALYLADEYLQEGDGVLLVSRESGKVMARITEEDVWLPPPVKREDGSLAQPLPRLRPELEGFLVQWVFDRSREEEVTRSLVPWAAGTSTAKALTHGGRKDLVDTLRGRLPDLLGGVRGSLRSFLDAFRIVGDDVPVEGLTPLPRLTAVARTKASLADLRATNFRYDVLASQTATIPALWVTEIARAFSMGCPSPRELRATDFDWRLLAEAPYWVASGTVGDLALRTGCPAFLTDATTSVGILRNPVGVIQVHGEGYKIASREVFDRWEVVATLEYTLWVDWSRTIGVRVEDERQAVVMS